MEEVEKRIDEITDLYWDDGLEQFESVLSEREYADLRVIVDRAIAYGYSAAIKDCNENNRH